jgi:HTH-type transcriptional repressor of NAD biosynthesis genes
VLAEKLARVYETEFVPEVARELLSSNDFTLADIIRIGHAHLYRIQEKAKTANKILFCDTDAITTQIYSRHYLGEVPAVLYEIEKKVNYDLYFLMDIDVPWIADGLRDLGDQRPKMFTMFKEELVRRNVPFIIIRGNYDEREQLAIATIDGLLS